jgi:hypothetical protein
LFLLQGCWPFPFGQARRGKYSHPEPPYTYTLADSLSQQRIRLQGFHRLVPDSMPPQARRWKAHNNVDLAWHNGWYYLAYRNAATHFPGLRVQLQVVRSPDFRQWEYVGTLSHRADLREPRFLVLHDTLRLYYFQGGCNRFQFQPVAFWQTMVAADSLRTPRTIDTLAGWVPWRLRTYQGGALLSAYDGRSIYRNLHQAQVRLWYTREGTRFVPVSDSAQARGEGAEEGEFLFDTTGNLWATVRYEGFGAGIAFAHRDSIARWDILRQTDKYDSALLFQHRGSIYLIARRDPARTFERTDRGHRNNMLRYSCSPKRTALYRLDTRTRRMVYLGDLPGRGDTAFAGLIPHPTQPNTYMVVNYSNNVNGPDRWWLRGQLGKTYLYAFELVFE